MSKINPVAIVILVILIVIPLTFGFIEAHKAQKATQLYKERESSLYEYNSANYYITGELYAVTPDGVKVILDANGKLWEIKDLHVTRHNRLLLEIRNTEEVIHVWTEVWTPSTK